MSIRSRARIILVAAASALGVVGVVVVNGLSSPNLALDCRVGEGFCVAILEPAAAQCPALFARNDAGGAAQRTARALMQLQEKDAISSFEAQPLIGGGCFVEVRLSVLRGTRADGSRFADGQAPAWRDTIDAAGIGSIVKDGSIAARPAYAKAGGCRAHVWAGEDPCAPSEDVGGDPDPTPDAGP